MIEKLAPDGYLQASEVEFTVADYGDEGGVQEVTPMKDEQVKGKITVEKKGDVLTGITENEDGSIDFVYEEKGLAGAVYEIYAKEDIVNPDGVSDNYYNAGDLVETLTTDSDGKATSSELPLGKYYVVETTAPEGYVLNSDQKDATLTYADQYTALVYDSVSFTNEKQGVEIKVIKQDKETGEYLEGAVFALYTTTDITDYQGNVLVTAGTEIGRVTTDDTGTATYSQDLPLGQYQVKKVQAPKGYASTADDTIDIDASYQGQLITVVSTEAGFENKEIEFEFSKTSITTGEELEGATLTIYEADENGNKIEDKAFETWVSTTVPHIVKGLEVGKSYVLEETIAPFEDGYVTSESIVFTVEDTEEVQKVHMTDNITTIEVEKQYEADGSYVPGAKLALYAVDEEGKVAEEATVTWTTSDGTETLTQIPVGKYMLVEKEAPEGYVKAAPELIEIKDTADVQAYTLYEKMYTMTKVDITGEEEVEGATITVIDEDGNVVDEWISTDEAHNISGLEEGKTYTLKETTAPDGYVTASEIEFTVSEEKTDEHISMVDKQVFFTKTDITGEEEVEGAQLRV